MTDPLTQAGRARWNALLTREGAALGLAGCVVFLENKLVNDVFFTGSFKGRDCVVKCSSRAPTSIENEFASSRLVHAADPDVCAEPLAFWKSPDGCRAFAVLARVSGPSLAQLLEAGLSDADADRFAGDVLRLAAALRKADVVHRDLSEGNLLLDADGHLKAIDFQFAVGRRDGREDPWLARNWKYRYVVFGVNRDLGLGVWNDFLALDNVLAKFPQTAAVAAVRRELVARAPEVTTSAPPKALDRLRLRVYAWSLRVQMLLRGKSHRKYTQLERRWRTASGRMAAC